MITHLRCGYDGSSNMMPKWSFFLQAILIHCVGKLNLRTPPFFGRITIPPTLVLGAIDDMAVMKEELFGPILPIRSCADTDGAIDNVNANERPLTLYVFGKSKAVTDHVLSKTVFGGVTVNDTIMHISQDDLPFVCVGASGMDHYPGHDRFAEFSYQKAVFRQMPFDMLKMLRSPYGKMFTGYENQLITH